MNASLYCFSGTGNSLAVAKTIHAALSDAALTRITSALVEQRPKIQAEIVGIVFPVYAWGPPGIVERFLQQAEITQPQYLFLVATHGGGPENALAYAANLLRRKQLRVDAVFDIQMPNNYITGSNPSSEEDARMLIQRQTSALEAITLKIQERRTIPVSSTPSLSGKIKSRVIHPLFTANAFRQGKKFAVSDACTHCGICAKVCPVENIRLNQQQTPEWGTRCEWCLACINWCPARAIESGSATAGRNRYHHPDVKLHEIIAN
ncbi:4Fe-4S ferredoxin iron-sulfur binding domain protein [Candidatus Moduliflexus flocculans]|uniref:4Fe-4S ferredoxin iron-sulfur binding domain protein n=1 Tax=Candidatus Moduliflexus flocculans TaxID=1499966 RepID=A0A0S6VPL4_9BACT|nr:4Fe-4S ferredoxin iron-sulfur binding domain protein [Candidatus Moduliflexus flocculans]